jgi:hypothetical protein
VAHGVAKTASLIYPERFRIAGLGDEIERLKAGVARCASGRPAGRHD